MRVAGGDVELEAVGERQILRQRQIAFEVTFLHGHDTAERLTVLNVEIGDGRLAVDVRVRAADLVVMTYFLTPLEAGRQ